jgi:predicted DNA-binding transcriptional regulator YafY
VRADRLIAILLMLQRRGRLSAAAIARELEVSRRTVMRDLEALGSAGVPIYAVRGPAGGYELWEGFRTQLTGLTADEVQALTLWGHPSAAAVWGLRDALVRAQLKVSLSVPTSMRGDLEAVKGVFLHDPTPAGMRQLPLETLEFLARAILRRRVVRARHRTWGLPPVSLYPLALIDKAGKWFVVADVEGDRRACSVDELGDLGTTGRRFHRPEDFDVAQFWSEWQRANHV